MKREVSDSLYHKQTDTVTTATTIREPCGQTSENVATQNNREMGKALTYVRQCELYFLGRGSEFSIEDSKIIFTLSYIKGDRADKWNDNMTKRVINQIG